MKSFKRYMNTLNFQENYGRILNKKKKQKQYIKVYFKYVNDTLILFKKYK